MEPHPSLVNVHVSVAVVDKEQTYQQQIRNDNGTVSVAAVAAALGEALAAVKNRLAGEHDDDIVFAFRKALTGERL